MDHFDSIDEEYDFFIKLSNFLESDFGNELVKYLGSKRNEYEARIESAAKKLVTEADIERYKDGIMKDAGMIRVYNTLLESETFHADACKAYAESLRQDLLRSSSQEQEPSQPLRLHRV